MFTIGSSESPRLRARLYRKKHLFPFDNLLDVFLWLLDLFTFRSRCDKSQLISFLLLTLLDFGYKMVVADLKPENVFNNSPSN